MGVNVTIDLLFAWHHKHKRTVEDVAVLWGISPNRLRQWMRWYGIEEFIKEEPPPKPLPKKLVLPRAEDAAEDSPDDDEEEFHHADLSLMW